MTDIVRPGRATVRLASEGVLLRCGLGRPAATKTCCSEGAEVAALRADCLDDHEVFLLALERVHLHGFEEVVGSVAHYCDVVRAKATGEVADGHAGAVDLSIVAAEEEVHVVSICDQGLVDWAGA